MGLNADQWHILCICLFPVIVIGGISMAVVLGFKEGSKLWFTLGVMFSAGILLSGAIVHSLPHASEAFDGLLGDEEHEEDVVHRLLRRLEDGEDHEEEHDHIFPWAATIFGLSFLFLMCVEAFAERAIDKYVGSKGGNFYGGAHHHEATEGEDEDHDAKPEPIVENSDSSEEADASDPVHTSKEGIVMVRTGTAAIKGNVRRRSSVIQNFLAVDKDGDIPSTYLVTSKRPSVIGVVVSHAPEEGIDDKQTVNPWVSLLLLIVLSIHVLLEGLTLGSDSDPESIRTNFIAIVFHKGMCIFALRSPFVAHKVASDEF
jgi:zinc transporter ZupT